MKRMKKTNTTAMCPDYVGVRRSLAWHRDLQRDLDRVQTELRVLPLLECLEGGRHSAEVPGLAKSRWLINTLALLTDFDENETRVADKKTTNGHQAEVAKKTFAS